MWLNKAITLLAFLFLMFGTVGACGAQENMQGAATVFNVAPTCRITAPYDGQQILVNRGVTFSSLAQDNNADPLTYLWDFADGTTTADTSSGVHTWTSLGAFTITLTVSDEEENAYSQVTVYVARETGGPGPVIPSEEEIPPEVPPANILLLPVISFAGYNVPLWLIIGTLGILAYLGDQHGIVVSLIIVTGFMWFFSGQLLAAIM